MTILETVARRLRARVCSERGATATEYGLLAGFIAFVIIAGVGLFGTSLGDAYNGFAALLAATL